MLRSRLCSALAVLTLLGCQESGWAAPVEAGSCRSEDRHQPVLVAAASSLQPALDEITRLYRRHHPSRPIRHTFAASGVLVRQIQQGAPVDLLITAAAEPMNRLQAQGLLRPGSRRTLLTNQLVLIVPVGLPGMRGFQDLTGPAVTHLAIGEPRSVPVGQYALEVLTRLGLLAPLRPKLVFAGNARVVLTMVASGNAEAGLVYRSDALSSPQVRIVTTAASTWHTPIRYPMALIQRSDAPLAARCYADFLQSAAVRSVFRRYGFGIPARQD